MTLSCWASSSTNSTAPDCIATAAAQSVKSKSLILGLSKRTKYHRLNTDNGPTVALGIRSVSTCPRADGTRHARFYSVRHEMSARRCNTVALVDSQSSACQNAGARTRPSPGQDSCRRGDTRRNIGADHTGFSMPAGLWPSAGCRIKVGKKEGVHNVHTLGFGSGRTGAGLARIPHISAGDQYLQGL